mgnify:CR=1 FL=1
MRRKLALLLSLVLLLSIFTACGKKEPAVVEDDGPDVVDDEPGDDGLEKPTEPMGQIIIGSTTDLTGDWPPYWQNSASDKTIWDFITGQATVDMTFEGEYVVNETVVENMETIDNEDGSKTYVWTIKDGLVYDDGTPITAKDYVATVMFWSSPVLAEMGGKPSYGLRYKGYNAFTNGESEIFEGVRLLDDKKFSVTIAEKYVPYFYELLLASVNPTKLDFYVGEEIDIADDGEGCYFTGGFTKENWENFEAKINGARRAIPRPSTGAYVLESYDEAAKVAVMKVNPNFPGDYTGQKPLIETVISKSVTQETALDELSTGGINLFAEVAGGDEINAGLNLVEKGGFSYHTFPRSGYGKLHFQCDFGPTQFVEVRQAIAHLLDRNDFATAFTQGFGSVVNGPYGEGQWFYQETKAELNDKLNHYPYSLEKAIELLEEGGWVLDANGNEYKGEGLRHKKLEDGTLMPLEIEWASSEKNKVSELLVVKLQENPDVAAAGMKINQTVMAWEELLSWMYRDKSEDPKYGVPTYGMYNLASGFYPNYDLTTAYTTDPAMVAAGYNDNFILDEELATLAADMALLSPDQREEFKKRFVDFIVKWNELLPDIPLYSNIYHDFYHEKLHDWQNNSLIQVPDAILYAWVSE